MPDRFIYWTLHINIDRHEAIYFPLYSGSKDVLHYEYLSTVTNTCVFFLVVFREGNFQIENHQKWKQSVFFYFLASEGFHAKLRLLIVMFEIRVRERKCHQVYQRVLKKKGTVIHLFDIIKFNHDDQTTDKTTIHYRNDRKYLILWRSFLLHWSIGYISSWQCRNMYQFVINLLHHLNFLFCAILLNFHVFFVCVCVKGY